MDLENYLRQVQQFIVTAGDRALNYANDSLVTAAHEGGDISTNLDEEIEQEFHDYVSKNFPEHGFKGEEFPELNKDAEFIWQIDPIDGTKFYAKGVPLWSVTASLVSNEEPLLGIVYNPNARQIHTAIKGKGAFLNGKTIKFNPTTDLSKMQAVWDLMTIQHLAQAYSSDLPSNPGNLTNKYTAQELFMQFNQIGAEISSQIYRLRSLGNGSLSLAWLAQGGFAAYICPCRLEAKMVDLNAGLLIATEAGAEVYTEKLGRGLIQVVVAPKELMPKIKAWISRPI